MKSKRLVVWLALGPDVIIVSAGACGGGTYRDYPTEDAASSSSSSSGSPATACAPGDTETCYSGPAGTQDVGICRAGTRTCHADGSGFGGCEGETLPGIETCDGSRIDEDCDGQRNESGELCVCAPGAVESCYHGPAGTLGVGACIGGQRTCAADGRSWSTCQGQRLPAPEVCDGENVDEDCDGQLNEEGTGCSCAPGSTAACYEGPDGTVGMGLCVAGTMDCLPSGDGYGPCENQVLPQDETCSGDLSDENCDGRINEGGAGCMCDPGVDSPCYDGAAGTLNVGTCRGGTHTCNAEGTGHGACTGQVLPALDRCNTTADEDCNGAPLSCDSPTEDCAESTGECAPSCSEAVLGHSNVGCEFYPTVTANIVESLFTFGVGVANTSNKPATVTVSRGATVLHDVTVAAQSARVLELPWVAELKGGGQNDVTSSIRVSGGAYRLQASRGVTVYQFNALEYVKGGTFSYTNDASLLLPINAWGTAYRAGSYPHWAFGGLNLGGLLSVVASQANTRVTLAKGAAAVGVRLGVAGLSAEGEGTVVLQAGDTLQLITSSGDLSGSRITADKPVQVLAGHQCTNIPDNVNACDHLEEAQFSNADLHREFLVTAPLISAVTDKAQIVRVVATEPNTALTYDPPFPGAPALIAAAGQVVTLPASTLAYRLRASANVIVQQFMQGQGAGGGIGDPAMSTVLGVDQYRTTYRFFASTNYEANYVNIVAHANAQVRLDGVLLAPGSFTAIGQSGYVSARRPLANNADGFHTVVGNVPVGASVYGYGQYTSYWYPAGAR